MGIFNEHSSSSDTTVTTTGERGPAGVGYKLDSNGNYDLENKKLVNVMQGTNNNDVVTKSQLDTKTSLLDGARTHGYIVDNKAVIYSQSGAVHAKSFYLQDQNEDEVRILTDNQDFDNVHLFVPNLKNFDGFGGRKRSEFMVTSVDQTVSGNKFFQNIKAPNPSEDSDVANKNYVDFEITKQNVLIDNEFVKKSGSLMTGDLILPRYNYPVQGNTNKAISYETQREIFISRKETFPMETSLDMYNNVIENIAEATSGHEALRKSQLDDALVIVNNDLSDKADKSYVDTKLDTKLNKIITKDINLNNKQLTNLGFNINDPGDVVNLGFTDQKYLQKVSDSNLNMDDHRVINSLEPINSRDLTTKNYVDSGLNAKLDKVSNSDLNMNGSNIKNVGINLSDDTTAVPRSYVDSFVNSAIHNPLDGDLYANNHQIKNLKTPSEDNDAVTKKYFEDQLLQSHLLPSHKDNALEYLLNVDESSSENNIVVQGIVDFNQSPHKNKKAYSITMIKDSGSNDYRSRIGINIYPLDIGFYTIIMEYYWPESTNIQLSCQATTAWINKQASKDFPDYTKLLVQFKQTSKDTPDRLFFNIHGEAVVSNPEGYLIFYGIKRWFDSVNPRIYDSVIEESMFQWKNNEMSINTDIDMQNHRLKNLPLPTDDDDAASKIYIDKINIAIQKKLILDFFHNTKDFAYKSTFGDGFYDLIESRFYHLKQNVSGIVIDKIMPNLFLETDRFIADYNPKYGLKLSTKSHVKVGKIFDQNNSFTFFMSFLHDNTKTGEISFSNTLNSHSKFYPRYRITSNKLIIDYQSGTYETQFTNDFQNKQLFIWICFDGSQNLYKMALSNYSSHISETFNPPSTFLSRQFEIDYDGFVNKIGFTDKFIDIDNMEFHRIMLEEKRNGSHFE